MKTRNCMFGMALLLIFPLSAWPQDGPGCNYSGNQSEMNACAQQDFEAADQELNRIYKALSDSLSKQDRAVLLKDQRNWLKKRDPLCKKEANDVAEGGSIWPLIFNGCRASDTKARIGRLKQWHG
ncbi:MAG: DUF1311 domain-containing protein [Methylococcales bacterium]|nr:DUF1311 domain-containing protein [Methylococcales bacterium]